MYQWCRKMFFFKQGVEVKAYLAQPTTFVHNNDVYQLLDGKNVKTCGLLVRSST